MNLFKKKAKWDLKEYCSQYFDKYILETKPVVAGMDMTSSYNEIILEKLTAADSNFKSVDFKKFCSELLTIRFELFSLAWFHEFGDKSGIQQEIFTRGYLTNLEKENIWVSIEPYNKAIAQSATHGCDSSTAFGRGRLSFVNTMRFELFKKYSADGLDTKCVARVLNKIGTDAKWKSLSVTLEYVGLTLCKDLDYAINEEARFLLTAFIKGFYDGSKQNLEEIKIVS